MSENKDGTENLGALRSSASELTRELCDELRDRWAMGLGQIGMPLPLVVGIECYEFFGEWVRIVEVNMHDEPHNAEVVVESRSMERKQVEFSELSWRSNYRLSDAMCRKSKIDVIIEGSD